MRDVVRLVDANANRAREALRVMEDVARFVLDDGDLCARVKRLRHGLREALDGLPGGVLLLMAHRDTPGDVGTGVTVVTEDARAGVRDVALAASRRLTESLRAIEEGAKVVARGAGEGGEVVARTVEALRYEAYEVEKLLTLALGAGRAGFAGWRVCVLITEALCVGREWMDVARGALEGGADCLQLREKELGGRELVARARALVGLAREFGVDMVVNDRPDVALAAGAAGVHLGQGDLAVEDVRRIAGDGLLVGVSVSTMDQARAARRAGADYCGVGAMFATMTKRKKSIVGPGLLAEYVMMEPGLAPALAIGGIGPENVAALVKAAGGRRFGVAVSASVCGAEDPARAVRDLLAAMASSAGDERSGNADGC